MSFIAYSHYVVWIVMICIFTGVVILFFDVNDYSNRRMTKERTSAVFLGWFNIVFGGLLLVWNWIYMTFIW